MIDLENPAEVKEQTKVTQPNPEPETDKPEFIPDYDRFRKSSRS
nr:MAG TPA: hypothetical protein [Caudoviricetes sp.]